MLASAQTALANATQFTLTEVLNNDAGGTSLGLPVGDNTVVVDFNGTLSNGIVTNLTDVSVFYNGHAFAGNGSLYASSQWNNAWQTGGAQIGFNQANSDFLISDVNFPNSTQEVNYIFDITGEPNAYPGQAPGLYVQGKIQNDIWTSTSYSLKENNIPEPTSIALLVIGTLGFASSRRKNTQG